MAYRGAAPPGQAPGGSAFSPLCLEPPGAPLMPTFPTGPRLGAFVIGYRRPWGGRPGTGLEDPW